MYPTLPDIDKSRECHLRHTQPCGNCWAVTAATVLTAVLRKHSKIQREESISEQLIMDCVNQFYNPHWISDGCLGGNFQDVAQFINEVSIIKLKLLSKREYE